MPCRESLHTLYGGLQTNLVNRHGGSPYTLFKGFKINVLNQNAGSPCAAVWRAKNEPLEPHFCFGGPKTNPPNCHPRGSQALLENRVHIPKWICFVSLIILNSGNLDVWWILVWYSPTCIFHMVILRLFWIFYGIKKITWGSHFDCQDSWLPLFCDKIWLDFSILGIITRINNILKIRLWIRILV